MWLTRVNLPAAHVGALLRLIREDRSLSVAEAATAITRWGYEASADYYSKIEAMGFVLSDGDRFLLTHGERFLSAYERALRLAPEEVVVVATQWGFDAVRRALGDEFARELFQTSFRTHAQFYEGDGRERRQPRDLAR